MSQLPFYLASGALLVSSHARAQAPAEAAVVCAGRTSCSISQVYDAGRATTGESLRVYKLRSKPGWNEPSLRDATCERFEYVAWKGPLDDRGTAQSLFVDCNDGYGPALRGADHVEIREGVFVHTRLSGAKHWQTEEVFEIRLDPWALVREKRTDVWNPQNHVRTALWDWEKFSGQTRWTLPVCKARRKQLAARIAQEGRPTLTFAYNPIPLIRGSDPFANRAELLEGDAWKSTDLTSCSTRVSSDGTRGFLVSGGPSTAADASLHVVATPEAIFVQVEDDAFVDAGAATPDVLTVSVVDESLQTIPICYARPVQVRTLPIEVRAGRVTAALPSGVHVDSVQAGGWLRIRLQVKLSGHPAVAVSYADSDDGAAVERTIATADLRLGDPTNIGPVNETYERDTRCVIEEGKLVPRVDAQPSEPLGPGL